MLFVKYFTAAFIDKNIPADVTQQGCLKSALFRSGRNCFQLRFPAAYLQDAASAVYKSAIACHEGVIGNGAVCIPHSAGKFHGC